MKSEEQATEPVWEHHTWHDLHVSSGAHDIEVGICRRSNVANAEFCYIVPVVMAESARVGWSAAGDPLLEVQLDPVLPSLPTAG